MSNGPASETATGNGQEVPGAPAVSVLLAVYNAERYVEQAVRSVLDQTFRDIEVVIIDDGSRDGSFAILQRLAAEDARIRLVSRPNKGIPATANEMIALARGRFLSLMDHDDVMQPDCIATEMAYLADHPECAAVSSVSHYIDGEGRITRRKRTLEILLQKVTPRPTRFDTFPPQLPFISNPASLVRADLMRRAGGYRLNMPYAHDSDLWLRLSRLGEIHRLNKALLHYRLHGRNTTVEHRGKIVQYEVVAVLSGACRACGLDDEALIGAFAGPDNYDATIAGYRDLLADRFPVETYVLYRAVGNRVPAVAGASSAREALARAWRHGSSRPLSTAKLALLRRAAEQTIRRKIR